MSAIDEGRPISLDNHSNPPDSKTNARNYACAIAIFAIAAVAVGTGAYFLAGRSINTALIAGGTTLGIELLGGSIVIVVARKKAHNESVVIPPHLTPTFLRVFKALIDQGPRKFQCDGELYHAEAALTQDSRLISMVPSDLTKKDRQNIVLLVNEQFAVTPSAEEINLLATLSYDLSPYDSNFFKSTTTSSSPVPASTSSSSSSSNTPDLSPRCLRIFDVLIDQPKREFICDGKKYNAWAGRSKEKCIIFMQPRELSGTKKNLDQIELVNKQLTDGLWAEQINLLTALSYDVLPYEETHLSSSLPTPSQPSSAEASSSSKAIPLLQKLQFINRVVHEHGKKEFTDSDGYIYSAEAKYSPEQFNIRKRKDGENTYFTLNIEVNQEGYKQISCSTWITTPIGSTNSLSYEGEKSDISDSHMGWISKLFEHLSE